MVILWETITWVLFTTKSEQIVFGAKEHIVRFLLALLYFFAEFIMLKNPVVSEVVIRQLNES